MIYGGVPAKARIVRSSGNAFTVAGKAGIVNDEKDRMNRAEN
jgi:hypothetical protein